MRMGTPNCSSPPLVTLTPCPHAYSNISLILCFSLTSHHHRRSLISKSPRIKRKHLTGSHSFLFPLILSSPFSGKQAHSPSEYSAFHLTRPPEAFPSACLGTINLSRTMSSQPQSTTALIHYVHSKLLVWRSTLRSQSFTLKEKNMLNSHCTSSGPAAGVSSSPDKSAQ